MASLKRVETAARRIGFVLRVTPEHVTLTCPPGLVFRHQTYGATQASWSVGKRKLYTQARALDLCLELVTGGMREVAGAVPPSTPTAPAAPGAASSPLRLVASEGRPLPDLHPGERTEAPAWENPLDKAAALPARVTSSSASLVDDRNITYFSASFLAAIDAAKAASCPAPRDVGPADGRARGSSQSAERPTLAAAPIKAA